MHIAIRRVVKKYNSGFNTSPIIGSAVNVSAMDVTKTTDYVGGKIFENNTLDRISVDGGYIKDGVYHFYETDHLGDNRTVINQSGTVVERNDYYPYGMQMEHNNPNHGDLVSIGDDPNAFKFSGKELDVMHGLNTYDFEARPYDLNYINFWAPDPKSEKKPWISPYVYCSDNPVNRVDPDGRNDYYKTKEGQLQVEVKTNTEDRIVVSEPLQEVVVRPQGPWQQTNGESSEIAQYTNINTGERTSSPQVKGLELENTLFDALTLGAGMAGGVSKAAVATSTVEKTVAGEVAEGAAAKGGSQLLLKPGVAYIVEP